jgi:hypothetical protein
MKPKRRRITGTVVRAQIAPGSKSEHVGVVLRTAKGDEYVLHRRRVRVLGLEPQRRPAGFVSRAEGFDTIPSKPSLHACSKTIAAFRSICSLK